MDSVHLLGISPNSSSGTDMVKTSCLPCPVPPPAFINLTSIILYRVTLAPFTTFRRLILDADALSSLKVAHIHWTSDSGHDGPHPSYRPSRSRLRTICVEGQRAWILNPRTLHFFTWMANSGVARTLSEADFGRVMILDDCTLLALTAVVEESFRTLRRLSLGFGPDHDMRLMARALQAFTALDTLCLQVPYHSSAFEQLVAFIESLAVCSLRRLYLKFDWSRICEVPTRSQWSKLDTALQLPQYLSIEVIAVARIGIDEYRPLWGNAYPKQVYDPDSWHPIVKAVLRQTFNRGVLAIWKDNNLAANPSLLLPHIPMPTLFVELCERIIDFVAGDVEPKETLRSCAATCRSWRTRSQAHLFRSLRVVPSSQHANNVDNLATLLQQHVSLQPFIRSLHVVGGGEKPPTLQNVFVRLGGLLAQVHQVTLAHGSIYRHPGLRLLSHYTKTFDKVTSLTLHNVTLYSGRDLQDLISGFYNLKEFTLSKPRWHGPLPHAAFSWTRPRMAELQKLSILSCSASWTTDPRSANLVRWLAHCGAVRSLESLHLEGIMILDQTLLREVQNLVHAASGRVEVLCLSIGPDIDATLLQECISACLSASVVALRLPYFNKGFSHLITFVNALSMRKLARLILSFVRYPDLSEPEASDWAQLDDTLHNAVESDRLPNLETVAVSKIWPQANAGQHPTVGDMQMELRSSPDHEWQDELTALLPHMHKRRRLASVTSEGNIHPVTSNVSLSSWDMTFAPFSRATPPAPWRYQPEYRHGSSNWEGRVVTQTVSIKGHEKTGAPSTITFDMPIIVIPRGAAPPWRRRRRY